jgi:uncharacterized damage-inducible protein DinB
MAIKQAIALLFERDIQRLHNEIAAFPSDELLWELRPGIANCSGNLALHLCGNLNHFIGATLGDTGYVRDRAAEFTTKNVSKAILLDTIADAQKTVSLTLGRMTDQQFDEDYPLEPLGYPMTVGYFLVHLTGHLNYHLGQINYHRRLLAPAS